jgi:hypothetical protein
MRLFYLLFVVISFLSCEPSSGDSADADDTNVEKETGQNNGVRDMALSDHNEIEKELESLSTGSQKITFHRLIIKSALDLHKEQSQLLQSHGLNSKEYKDATKVVEQLEKENLARTLGFIEMFGISSDQSVGRMQASAMWLVLSHNSDVDVYSKVYVSFHEAWELEYLDGLEFASYLQDFYLLKNGKMLELKNPYRTEDEIRVLMKELGTE